MCWRRLSSSLRGTPVGPTRPLSVHWVPSRLGTTGHGESSPGREGRVWERNEATDLESRGRTADYRRKDRRYLPHQPSVKIARSLWTHPKRTSHTHELHPLPTGGQGRPETIRGLDSHPRSWWFHCIGVRGRKRDTVEQKEKRRYDSLLRFPTILVLFSPHIPELRDPVTTNEHKGTEQDPSPPTPQGDP